MIGRDDEGQLAALQRRVDNMRIMRKQKERIAELEASLAGAKREADDWYKVHLAEHAMYLDLGRILGADVPTELIAEVAHRRMERIAELEAELAALVHPFDLDAYRAKKTLHK